MTDNITDNEIIKALECCKSENGNDCENCQFANIIYRQGEGGCVNRLMSGSLDLIHRKDSEIERLLQKLQQAQSEAIKEFAEKVDEILCLEIGPSKRVFWKISEGIKNLVKEMEVNENDRT